MENTKVLEFVDEYGQTDLELAAAIGYVGELDSDFSEFAINMGYRWCFSHQVWFSRESANYDNEENKEILEKLTTQDMNVLPIGTEIRWCKTEPEPFYKFYKKYKIVDYLPFSKKPYEVSCEEGPHNGMTESQCSFSQEEIEMYFQVPDPAVELRESENYILIAGKNGFVKDLFSMVYKANGNQSHWFNEGDKNYIMQMSEEQFEEQGEIFIPKIEVKEKDEQ